MSPEILEGVIPIKKPKGITSFDLVRLLRRHLKIKKIGHAGTLDPFATGVMIMLVGRKYTRISDHYLKEDKEYIGRIHLGVETDTYDCDGKIVQESSIIPTQEEIEKALRSFQGQIQQLPPMYSAKKIKGKKLYEFARKGQTIERSPSTVTLKTELITYHYPYLDIKVACSKGTYIRSIAHDLGQKLGCGGHLSSLNRTRCGQISLADCFDGAKLQSENFILNDLIPVIQKTTQCGG